LEERVRHGEGERAVREVEDAGRHVGEHEARREDGVDAARHRSGDEEGEELRHPASVLPAARWERPEPSGSTCVDVLARGLRAVGSAGDQPGRLPIWPTPAPQVSGTASTNLSPVAWTRASQPELPLWASGKAILPTIPSPSKENDPALAALKKLSVVRSWP